MTTLGFTNSRFSVRLVLACLCALAYQPVLATPIVSPAVEAAEESATAHFLVEHDDRVAKNPTDLHLDISVPKRVWEIGDSIPVTFIFKADAESSYSVNTGNYDRSGRIDDLAFYVDGSKQGFRDPLETWFGGVRIGGGLHGYAEVGRYEQTFVLNEWIRFDMPGTYKVYATTSRASRGNYRDIFGSSVNLTSPIITLTIRPLRNEERKLRTAQRRIAFSDRKNSSDRKKRYEGVRMLRCLATPRAIELLVPLVEDEDPQIAFEAMFGIVGARDRPHARDELSRNLRLPKTIVGRSYLQLLNNFSLPDALLVPLPYSEEATLRSAWFTARRDAEQTSMTEAHRFLRAALPLKNGRAAAVAAAELLSSRYDTSDEVSSALARNLLSLTENEQTGWLRYFLARMRHPDLIPALNQIVRDRTEAFRQHGQKEGWRFANAPSLALQILLELEPETARRLILDDIADSNPYYSSEALCALPDSYLPTLEDTWVRYWNLKYYVDQEKISGLIERYATPALLSFIREQEGTFPTYACGIVEPLLGYWIKSDRTEGLQALERFVKSRDGGTRCYAVALGEVLPHYYGPDAEALAIKFIDDPVPDVAVDAIRLLGKFPSDTAAVALVHRWDQLLAKGQLKTQPDEGGFCSEKNLIQVIKTALQANKSSFVQDALRARIEK